MCGGMQRYTDGCMEGLVKVYKGTQGAQRYAGCTEMHTGMCRGAWGWAKVHSGVLKCMEECIGLQRDAQRCVEVHRGYRGCAEVHRGVCRGVGRCMEGYVDVQRCMDRCAVVHGGVHRCTEVCAEVWGGKRGA